MTTIKPITATSTVLRIDHVDHEGGDVLMGLDRMPPNLISQIIRYPLAELLAALDAEPKSVAEALRETCAALETVVRAVTAERDAHAATIGRVRSIAERYNSSALALSEIRAALAPKPAFVLPTEVPARIECFGGITEYKFTLWNDGELHWIDEDDWHNVVSPDEIMSDFTGHRLLDGDE